MPGKHQKMVTRPFAVALVLLLIRYMAVCLAIPKSSFTDESALLAFKEYITHDPSKTITSNWSTATPFCHWLGVTCSARHQRVIALDLSNMDLKGTIPPHVGNLSFLVSINFSNNSFQGDIPNELSKLHRLKSLYLVNNRLTGTIPPSLYNVTSLEALYLNNNLLQGILREQISNLSNLKGFVLNSNMFSGDVPPSIFNMTSLQVVSMALNNLSGSLQENMCNGQSKLRWLDISQNQLSGEIPSDLYKCKELEIIALDTNSFTGTIPREFGNCTKLKWLYLGANNLKGEIPLEILSPVSLELLSLEFNSLQGSLPREIGRSHSLRTLYMDRINLTGSIPKEIGNCSFLEVIFLGNNSLTGTIPREISNLHNLQVLRLGLNNMVGTIPSEIFNFTTMTMIELTRNHFSGHFPPSMGLMLPNLQEVYLSGNDLSGPIPDAICNASQLVQLILSNNSFSGFVPDCLGNLSYLQYLDLEYNLLTSRHSPSGLSFISSLTNCRNLLGLWIGKNPLRGSLPISAGNLSSSLQSFTAHHCKIQGRIPEEIGNLNNLIELNLKGNELVGEIPSTIGRLRQLQALILAQNKLEGRMPHELCDLERLAYLHLDGNDLVGSLPDCLGSLKSIRNLILASNKFSGSIPSSLWGLQDILQLDLSSNSLNGSLPLEIKNLKVVIAMDISRNQLSGAIPNSIGDLQDLLNLSLSGNRLQGIIPPSFGKMVGLEVLDLSSNNLSGEIPMSMENLTHLRYFNVCFNQLQGEIPNEGPFSNFSIQSFLGNEDLCGAARLQVHPCKGRNSRSSKTPGKIMLRYILPAITSTLFVLALILIIIRCRRQNKKHPAQADLPSLATWKRISRRELELATGGFHESNLLGTGSFGSVFKGTLPDGLNIAVKVFNLQQEAAFASFDTECEVLRNLRHRNLVTIISSCSNLDFRALVLEFMPNLTLEKWLYSDNQYLDIVQRLSIMIDVASALEYLHYGNTTPVVHCDLKPSNVLLDEHMVAHLGDFGIAKLLGQEDSMTQTMTLATIGYMAPEYGSEGNVSIRGDVYSFGILLMETFTRMKPTDEMFAGEMSLKNWVKKSLPNAVTEIVDANLLRREGEEQFVRIGDCVTSILELALECSADLPEERKDMKYVLTALEKIKKEFTKEAANRKRH